MDPTKGLSQITEQPREKINKKLHCCQSSALLSLYGTPKWMVYFMENPIKMDDLGVPLFLETPMVRFQWQPFSVPPPTVRQP